MKKEGYQKLPNTFFEIMKQRGVSSTGLLLLVYLRGKMLRFRCNPFTLSNGQILQELPIAKNTLKSVRLQLREKGLLTFKSGGDKKRDHSDPYSHYQLYDAVIAKPTGSAVDLVGVKGSPRQGQPLTQSINKTTKKITNKTFSTFSKSEEALFRKRYDAKYLC